jgi:hypothetical protein
MFQTHCYSENLVAPGIEPSTSGSAARNDLLFIYGAGVEPSPLLLRPFVRLLYQSWMVHGDDCGANNGMN